MLPSTFVCKVRYKEETHMFLLHAALYIYAQIADSYRQCQTMVDLHAEGWSSSRSVPLGCIMQADGRATGREA